MSLACLFLLITVTPVVFWWATALSGSWDDPSADVLIVLTGSGMEDGIIGMNSYWRAVYAVRAYQREHVGEILISGAGDEHPPLAETMRSFLLGQGVPAEVIRVETASKNTHDSGVNIARIVAAEPDRYRNRKLVLMTSDYHMYRSQRVFAKAGVAVLPRPIPDIRKRYGARMDRWGLFGELADETVKVAYYRVRGWI
ncbi:MAG: YdcF family protein [Bryobacteraceae bacterium]